MKDKKILIIGGTGALGKALINEHKGSNDILILSRDEHKQVYLSNIYSSSKNINFIIGDIKEKDSIIAAIGAYKPQIVINTAALKHVPICESNPIESVKVNIIGNQNLIESVENSVHKIETLIFVSTDKACKPINVYGMCKSISEKLYIEYAKNQKNIKVCIVRYGNVLESTGSVIPFFKHLLEKDEKFLPITDMRMTRFLLTLAEAINLIKWSYAHEKTNGQVVIPKIKSLMITDIAKALIKWYYGNESAIELRETGIRMGEKIHEELISKEEWLRTEEYENYLISNEIIKSEGKSYNSYESLMPKEEVYEFLITTGVLEKSKYHSKLK